MKYVVGPQSRESKEVEVKLSTHPPSLWAGYASQLETHKAAEQTMRAIQLVLDVGHMGDKDTELLQLRNAAAARHQPLPGLAFVDARLHPPASRRGGRVRVRAQPATVTARPRMTDW